MIPIKIAKYEKDIVAADLTRWSIPYEFYTIEENEDLLLVMIDCKDLATMFLIGKLIGHHVEIEEMKKALLS